MATKTSIRYNTNKRTYTLLPLNPKNYKSWPHGRS